MNFKKRREEVGAGPTEAGEKKGGFKTYKAKWAGWAWQPPDAWSADLTDSACPAAVS